MLQLKQFVNILAVTAALACAKEFNALEYTEERIFGGHLAAEGQFPYLVSIRANITNEFKHLCGGSIITNRFVVTAAHCILHNDTNRFRLALVAYNISGDGSEYKVEQLLLILS